MILIRENSKSDRCKKGLSKVPKETLEKMPVFNCSCGVKILIVPDLPAMNEAIENHLIEHKRITGQILDEEIFVQEILISLAEA